MTLALAQDITLNRNAGDPCSADAHERLLPHKQRMQLRVERLIWAAGDRGLTAKEIAGELGLPLHHISGRCTELVALHRAYKNGLRRQASAVLVAPRQTQGRLL